MKPYVIDALCELASEQVIESRPALMVKGDGLAHQWRVAVVSRGEPVDLSGCSVAGYFVQNGEQTVRQPGVVSGNVAIVEIPDAVYGVSGPVDAFMRLTDATRKATISMIRTACEDWDGRFKKDIFGREIKDNDGNSVLSEDFDENQKYVSRTDRKEWGTVGLLGKLILIDDGTCEINGYVAPTSGGIGTKSTVRTKFRVMKRLDATHVKVLVL